MVASRSPLLINPSSEPPNVTLTSTPPNFDVLRNANILTTTIGAYRIDQHSSSPHIAFEFTMEEPQALFCPCGRIFYQTGSLANHRRSCPGTKRKVESALQGMNPEKWKKKRKSAAPPSLTVSSSTQVYSEPGPSHVPESIAAMPDVPVEVCDAKFRPSSTSVLQTDKKYICCFRLNQHC